MTLIDVGRGVRLHVQDLGTGPAVVLISGFGLDHQLWDRQVRVLTDRGYRVLCVDQRGHGLSDKPLDGYDIDQLATDLLTVLGQLDIADATVVGHSFGGQVAFRAAAASPAQVTRLVLVGSNAVRASRGEGFPFGAPPEAVLPTLLADEHERRIESRYRGLAGAFGEEPEPRILQWLLSISLQMPSWAALACYRALLTTDLLSDIPLVTVPVLQVIGAKDPVFSAKGARWLQQHLHTSTLVEFEDCGHYPMIEVPDEFDDALIGFLGPA